MVIEETVKPLQEPEKTLRSTQMEGMQKDFLHTK